MNLGQMRLEVRRAVAELTADLWSDAELNDWLNEGAKILAANAQCIQAIYQVTTVSGIQDYVLPDDVDEIFSVTYFDSSALPLTPIDGRQVQVGTAFTGRPRYFYTRAASVSSASLTSTGISAADADSQNPQRSHFILGLFPTPNAAKQLSIFYYSRHFQMKTDGAVPNIPPEYRRGIVHYATAIAKEKEVAYGEADRQRKLFQEYSDRLKEKMGNEGQEIAFPTVRTEDDQVPYGDVIIRFGTAT